MARREPEALELLIQEVEVGPLEGAYHPVRLGTTRGNVAAHYYPSPDATRGAIWVGGVGGGFDTPANGLYPRLSEDLQAEGIASLRVRFRHPTRLEESILDVLAGIGFLEEEGVETFALTGHSFGGAVVVQAAVISDAVRTVVTLATQGYGADPVAELAPRASILLVHGTADRVLPPSSSEYVHQLAREPKQLVLYEGAGHNLDEVAPEVYQVVREWVVEKLRGG